MQGRADSASFIRAFAGSHHFIIDYLVEEVLLRQPERVRSFLLQSSILDRLSGRGETTGKAEKRERGRKNADLVDSKVVVRLKGVRQAGSMVLGDSKVVARQSHPYRMCLQMGTWWAGARGLGVVAADYDDE